MRILIVDDDPLNASRLKLVFSKFGRCDIASEVEQAVDSFAIAHTAGAPYDFMTLEMDKQPLKGAEVALRALQWAKQNGKEHPMRIMLMIEEQARQDIAPSLQEIEFIYLDKPYNRKKLETTLEELGLEKSATPSPEEISAEPAPVVTPPPPPKPQPEENRQVQSPEVEAVLKKLNAYVHNAEQFQGLDARILLEELVKQGGRQAELMMVQFIGSNKISLPVRLEIIRSAGYIHSPLFLVPLNKIIDTEENIRLVEAALMSIAKYNNQRALNILNNALKKLKNPMLLNTIRREAAKIKENNPVLSILPRFLQSYNNRKNFKVTVDILKKIVTQKDVPLFINYLKSGNNIIEVGTFELLCFVGDTSIKKTLFNFFEERLLQIPCVQEPHCEELYYLLTYFNDYFVHHPDLVEEQFKELSNLYLTMNDEQAKQIILSIYCKSANPEILEFVKSIYQKYENLRDWIVEELSGNEGAVEFLFEKFHAGEDPRGKIVIALLKCDRGVDYFITHFFSLPLDKQELIIKNLPFANKPSHIEFIRSIYKTNLYSMKNYLLTVIKDNFLFMFRDILFAKESQREFMFMGKEYLDTISRLFPITTMMLFFKKIATEDISTNKVKAFLERVQFIGQAEPVIVFRDIKLLYSLFERIAKSNNIELNTLFFQSFENIRTLDPLTYRTMIELINKFTNFRGAAINEGEKATVTKLKQRLIDHFPDIREIQNLGKELKVIFLNQPVVLDQLVKYLKSNPVAVALNIEKVVLYLAGKFKNPMNITNEDRDLFNVQLPLIGKLIQDLIAKDVIATDDFDNIPITGEPIKKILSEIRVMFRFANPRLTAVFKDQLEEIIPGIQIFIENEPIKATDILICDATALKSSIDSKEIVPKQILLYLENRMEYAAFRGYNPKAFMKPLSAYRVVKMILQELFFPV